MRTTIATVEELQFFLSTLSPKARVQLADGADLVLVTDDDATTDTVVTFTDDQEA